MTNGANRPAVVLAALAIVAGAALAPLADAAGRNRQLERVLEHSMYSAGEGGQIQRAFANAEKAGVDDDDLLALVEACADGEFDADQTLRMLSLAAQLAVADLPVDALVAKVEEGVSKRVDADRVVQAAATRAVTLNRAKSIIQAAVLDGFPRREGDELYGDVAAALEVGRTQEEIRAAFAAAIEDGDGASAVRKELFP